jgi:hypothetical protein
MKMGIGRFLEVVASANPEQLIWLQTNLVHKLLSNPSMFGMHGSIVDVPLAQDSINEHFEDSLSFLCVV